MVRVLFVCLGNICRSPMAEAIFQRLVDDAGLTGEVQVDSAGTSAYHVGEQAHPGTRRVLARHGIQYSGRARQLTGGDAAGDAAYLIAMDSENVADLQRRFGEDARIHRLLEAQLRRLGDAGVGDLRVGVERQREGLQLPEEQRIGQK